MNETVKSLSCALAFGAMTLLARGDWLVATNGERFVGTVIEENSTNVVFDSELGGRLVFPQAKIRDLYRTPLLEAAQVSPVAAVTNAPTNALAWMPRGVFVHRPIAATPSIRGELAIGWGFHYVVGIAYAALYLAITRLVLASGPTLITALVFAIALTAVSFVVAQTNLLWGPGVAMGLIVLAIAQIGVHLVFFLHMGTGPDHTNNIIALAFGMMIVFLVLTGSVWIMWHLNDNMMPMSPGMH